MNALIENHIRDYVKSYPEMRNTQTIWEDPLVAVADARDPMFHDLKKTVSPSHQLPQNLLAHAVSVICYFLPFARDVSQSNGPGPFCSDSWAYAYLETNQLVNDLNSFLQEEFNNLGYQIASTQATHNFNEKTLLSDWSHRHVAVIAGLGTLGLHRMLITEKGCCGRLGSLITDMPLVPTSRPSIPACLYQFNNSCYRCIKNCSFDALQEIDFHRFKCYDNLLNNAEFHKEKGFVDACGKCLCHIPCSTGDPVKRLTNRPPRSPV
ncbi:MAG TPA: epoxyqueuosine reductase [Syntrophomonadaceae bacterium]|nr:epoxyqueuosine reductase [Syntrophomonadaceae bacterium]